MDFDPNINDMTAHLALLYDWTQTDYPNALFEIRCINPNGGTSPNERFACTPTGYQQAADYAAKHNAQGYNCYTTVNPLKPNTTHTATDTDVEIARYHVGDFDGIDHAVDYQGFEPTFIVQTGTTPLPRFQTYWLQSEPITDMVAWTGTQKGLIQHLGCDKPVKNPSRVLRLAGSVSYPPPHKQKRGYVVELTSLTNGGGDVCKDSFAASYPYSGQRAIAPPIIERDPLSDTSGNVPPYVIQAAFDAIPALIGKGNCDKWLDISQCARDANPHCFPEFDTWQRRSDRYNPKQDSNGWPLKATPRQGSYLGLFKYAKYDDERWWSHDPDVYEWWCHQQTKRAAYEHPVFGDDGDPSEEPTNESSAKLNKERMRKFRRYSMTDLLGVPIPKWLIRDLIYERQIAVLCAPSGSYKSFLTLALSSMLAHAMPWQGRPLKMRRVIYLAGEGFPLFGMRRLAWFKHHKMAPRDDGLEVIDGTVNLLDDEDVNAFIESAGDALDTEAVVLDTLSTSTAGQDENTSPVMTKAVSNAQRIGRALGCAVIIVHHPGKDIDRGLRGHSSLGANTDAVWLGEKIEDGKKLLITTVKQKDGIANKLFCFAVHAVPLGIYEDDGIEITSLVLDICDTPEAINEQRHDFCKVASVMKIDETLSIAQIVKRVLDNHLMDCKPRAAATRVSKAVPTKWTPYEQFAKMVELIRIPAEKNGQPHKISMRLVEQCDA